MRKFSLASIGMTLAAVALMGAGCSGAPSSSPADAFKAGLEAGNQASAAVVVESPKAGDTVTIPVEVKGSGAMAGEKVYAGLYEFGNLATEAEVTADASGNFTFSQIWLLGEHDANLELRVGQKDEVGNLIKFVKIPLTVNPAE